MSNEARQPTKWIVATLGIVAAMMTLVVMLLTLHIVSASKGTSVVAAEPPAKATAPTEVLGPIVTPQPIQESPRMSLMSVHRWGEPDEHERESAAVKAILEQPAALRKVAKAIHDGTVEPDQWLEAFQSEQKAAIRDLVIALSREAQEVPPEARKAFYVDVLNYAALVQESGLRFPK